MKGISAIILSVFFFLSSASEVFAQPCPTCPALFTLTDSTGCNSADITKNPTIFPYYTNRAKLITACKNSRMRYSLNVDPICFTGITYSFVSITGGTLITQSNNQFAIQWGSSNTANIVIAFFYMSNSGGAPCADTISLNIGLTNTPVAAFTSAPQPACFNNPTNINFNSSGSVNAVNYYWNFGDGFTSMLANPSHSYTAPGSYTVTLIVTNSTFVNGQPSCPDCIDSVSHQIVINALPGPPITCVAGICAGATETYCTSASGCTTYTWSVTGGIIQSGQNTACVTIKWGTGTPQGTLTLVTTGCTPVYCPQGTTVTIPIVPATFLISGPSPVCVGTAATYSLPAWPGTTYSWNLSGGGSMAPYNTNTNQVNINWAVSGNHVITCNYFDSSLNCGGVATQTVIVRPHLNISGPSSFCVASTNSFNATRNPSIAVPSNWTITPAGANIISGNGTASINVSWPLAGTYTITATSATANIVCDAAGFIVTVNPAPVISAINGKDSICPNKPYVYVPVSNGSGPFTWTINNGVATLLGSNNDSAQIVWNATGPYSITVSQTSFPNNCISNSFIKNVFKYPPPALSGPVNVCADMTATYTITNISGGNFQWSVYPPSFGTILTGQGTATVQIKWHGNNNPGFSNTVHLYYGVCNSDSVAIVINEPQAATITASGTLCGGGVTLSTGATGTFNWVGVDNPLVPNPGNVSSVSGITLPGNYDVTIQNFNGTGCTVFATYFIPDVGRPVASISATNVLNYCLPAVPNMNLVAANGPGYTFQWYNSSGLIPGATSAMYPISGLTTAGSYTYYCIVSLGSCSVTSNLLTIIIQNCPAPGCIAQVDVTSISGCNPFTLTIAATSPAGSSIVPGSATIYHYDDATTVSGLTTHSFTSTGYQQIRVCANVLYPDNVTVCSDCKDTVVLVTAAANFTANVNCGMISLYNASTVISPATISSYAWSVGYNPGNTPVPLPVASFNNNTIQNPVLTITQSGNYMVSLTIKSGTCFITHRDTFNMIVPDADFNVTNSCVGTTVSLNNLFPAPVNYWDFGDAATSYTSPTSHAYGTANTYLIKHIVTDVNGCKDTVSKNITISPSPVCNITYSGPTTFCFKDSLILNACAGFTNYQWYNNGVAIAGATTSKDTVRQTGNYSFTAINVNGCKVVSDTVSVTVNQQANVSIVKGGSYCVGSNFTATIPPCAGCFIQWNLDGFPEGFGNQISGVSGTAPFTAGPHTLTVIAVNGAGCTDSSSIPVVFSPLPVVSIAAVPNPPLLCSNNLYTLTATGNAAIPQWSWNFNNMNIVLSTTNSVVASAGGSYNVVLTDAATGCKSTATQVILPSPELNLFPAGCDTLCDTSHLYLPLASFNGNLSGYTIQWFDNAPPYAPVAGSGPSFPLSNLTLGNHSLSVIVTSPNGCKDTSNVYSVKTFSCLNVVAVNSIQASVKQDGNFAMVKWKTEQEYNNDHFDVERSTVFILFMQAVYNQRETVPHRDYTVSLMRSLNIINRSITGFVL